MPSAPMYFPGFWGRTGTRFGYGARQRKSQADRAMGTRKKVKVSITMDPQLVRAMDKARKPFDMNRSEFIRDAVAEQIETTKAQQALLSDTKARKALSSAFATPAVWQALTKNIELEDDGATQKDLLDALNVVRDKRQADD